MPLDMPSNGLLVYMDDRGVGGRGGSRERRGEREPDRENESGFFFH